MPAERVEERLARIRELADRGLKPSAAQLSRLILEKDARNVEALVWLARTSSQPDEAEKALQQAAALQPDHPEVRAILASRQQPASGPGANGAYNPFAIPTYSQPGPPAANNSGGYQPSAPPNPYPPSQPASSFEYLRNLSSTANPAPPTVAAGISETARPVKVRRGPRPLALIFGLLFFLGGLGLAIYWTLSVLDYNADLEKGSRPYQAQITRMETGDNIWRLVADVKDQGTRTYQISKQMYNTLEPLVRDQKTNTSLAGNTTNLYLTQGGRLTSVEVQSPNKGTATNALGLLGLGQATDWGITALGAVMTLIGMVLLGRSFGKPHA